MTRPDGLNEGAEPAVQPASAEKGVSPWDQAVLQINQSLGDLREKFGEIQGAINGIPQMNADIREVRDSVRDMKSAEEAVNNYRESVRVARDQAIKIIRIIAYLIFGLFTVGGIIFGIVYTILNHSQPGGGG